MPFDASLEEQTLLWEKDEAKAYSHRRTERLGRLVRFCHNK